MPSETHAQMVLAIKQLFLEQYVANNQQEWDITIDHHKHWNCPPIINGYKPDFYAWSLSNKLDIIGEAKVRDDLLTKHSNEQIASFLRYLKEQKNRSILILCVSLGWIPDAKNLIKSLKFKTNIVIHLIDQTGFEHYHASWN